MMIPTEPIGSLPRPPELIAALEAGVMPPGQLTELIEAAVRDSVRMMEAAGSPVVSDGQQGKSDNFWTYCVHAAPNTAPDGFPIPFAAGRTRRMRRLTRAPFRYQRYADAYPTTAQRYARVPVKQALVSPSALSLRYPPEALIRTRADGTARAACPLQERTR